VRILVIHQQYLGPGEPGSLRFNEFARIWSEAGHDVCVVAGTVNYATGRTRPENEGIWLKNAQDGHVDVWRAHMPASYSKGYRGRMWSFLGFTMSGSHGAWRAGPADVVIASSPPLIAAIPGWVAARVRNPRAKFVFEMRDLWPESAVTTGVLKEGAPLTRTLYALEARICKSADRIAVLTPAFEKDLVRRGLKDRADIWTMPNGADTEMFLPGDRENAMRRRLGWGQKTVALYTGAHGRANALTQLILAAQHLRERPDVLIACVGDGPERRALEAHAAEAGLDNIRFHGAFAKDQMPEIVRAADIGVAVLQNNPTFKTVYPNKVFDYMCCEKPVVLGIDGAIRELVLGANAGVFSSPEDPLALAAAIAGLADDTERCRVMGRAGRAWVETHWTREAVARRYLRELTALVAGTQPTAAQESIAS